MVKQERDEQEWFAAMDELIKWEEYEPLRAWGQIVEFEDSWVHDVDNGPVDPDHCFDCGQVFPEMAYVDGVPFCGDCFYKSFYPKEEK